MTSLAQIEGIGGTYAKRLGKRGVKTTQSLLAHGFNRKGRKELAQATGLSEELILEWVGQADVMQVRGIGPEYADLLESAGIDTSKELAHRNPKNLAKQLAEVNQKRKLVRKLPTLEQIKAWVLDAIAIHRAPHGLAGDSDIDAPPPPKKHYILEY
jgi:predicted flap endonuclease-1-like 5' DNA nuclease